MLKNILGIRSKEERTLERFEQSPRYTKGDFIIEGKKVKFPDVVSFAFIYKELFNGNIYKYKAETQTPLVIDCGANIGLSVIYFKTLYPKSRIIAFEPDPFIFQYLKHNIEEYRFEDVQLVNAGLWKEDTILSFKSEGSDSGRIEENAVTNNSIKVERLSKYLNQKVNFLKIDIEGAEVEVFKEISSLIGNVKNIFVEFHSFKNQKQNLSEILNVLSDNNFRYFLSTPLKRESPFIENSEFMGMDGFVNVYGINQSANL